MAAFFKFNQFVEDRGKGVHNLSTGALKVYLTNATPDAALDAVKADLAEITAGNGYTAGGHTVANQAYEQTSGTAKLTGDDITITAAGGSIGPFRYAVLYNDTPISPADPLIGAWDYSSALTLLDGESLLIDFNATNGLLQDA
jgi:hypothetical protein